MTPSYRTPPRTENEEGSPRRVGVEIEFAGVPVENAVSIVRDLYGGEDTEQSRFEHLVTGTKFGDFRVEIDSKPLLAGKHHRMLGLLGLGDERAKDVVDGALERIARVWIPCEIVAPPIPYTDLPELEHLRAALCRSEARGTKASVIYGFGFQLNVEVPDSSAETLLRYLQSFLVLYDWLSDVISVDVTRRLGPFINPFPEDYRRKVLDPTYEPDVDTLIDDYLLANATRNRPLDMLPVFATLDEHKVAFAARDFEKVKARPAFHYRLPNCLVDDPAWTFAVEWNRWCEVERLAADAKRIHELEKIFAERAAGGLGKKAWIAEVAEIIG
jgi:hypothetical protein